MAQVGDVNGLCVCLGGQVGGDGGSGSFSM